MFLTVFGSTRNKYPLYISPLTNLDSNNVKEFLSVNIFL